MGTDYLAELERLLGDTPTAKPRGDALEELRSLLEIDEEPPPAPPPDDFRDVSAEDPEEEYKRRKAERAEREANFDWSSVEAENASNKPNPESTSVLSRIQKGAGKVVSAVFDPWVIGATDVAKKVGGAVGDGDYLSALKELITAPVTAPIKAFYGEHGVFTGDADKRAEKLSANAREYLAENPDETGLDIAVSRGIKKTFGAMGRGAIETATGTAELLGANWTDKDTQEFISLMGGEEGLVQMVFEDFANPLNVLIGSTLGDLIEGSARIAKRAAKLGKHIDIDVLKSIKTGSVIPSELRTQAALEGLGKYADIAKPRNYPTAGSPPDPSLPIPDSVAKEQFHGPDGGRAKAAELDKEIAGKKRLFEMKEEKVPPPSMSAQDPLGKRSGQYDTPETFAAREARDAQRKKVGSDFRNDPKWQRLQAELVRVEDLARNKATLPNDAAYASRAKRDKRRDDLFRTGNKDFANDPEWQTLDRVYKKVLEDAEKSVKPPQMNYTDAIERTTHYRGAEYIRDVVTPFMDRLNKWTRGLITNKYRAAARVLSIDVSPVGPVHQIAKDVYHEVGHSLLSENIDKEYAILRTIESATASRIEMMSSGFDEVKKYVVEKYPDWTDDDHILETQRRLLGPTPLLDHIRALGQEAAETVKRLSAHLDEAMRNTPNSTTSNDQLIDVWGRAYKDTKTELINKDPQRNMYYSEQARWAFEHVLFNRNPIAIAAIEANPELRYAIWDKVDKAYEASKADGFVVMNDVGPDARALATEGYLRRQEIRKLIKRGENTPINEMRVEAEMLLERLMSNAIQPPSNIIDNAVVAAAAASPSVTPVYKGYVEATRVIAKLQGEILRSADREGGILSIPKTLPDEVMSVFTREGWKKTVDKYRTLGKHFSAIGPAWKKAGEVMRQPGAATFSRISEAITTAWSPGAALIKELGTITYDVFMPYTLRNLVVRKELPSVLKNVESLISSDKITALRLAEMVNRGFSYLPPKLRHAATIFMRRDDVMKFYRENGRLPIHEVGFDDANKWFDEGMVETFGKEWLDPAYVLRPAFLEAKEGFSRVFDQLVESYDALLVFRKETGQSALMKDTKPGPGLIITDYNATKAAERFGSVGFEDELLKVETGGDVGSVSLDTAILGRKGDIRDPNQIMAFMWEDAYKGAVRNEAEWLIVADTRLRGKFVKESPPVGWVDVKSVEGPLADGGFTHIHPDADKMLTGYKPFEKQLVTTLMQFVTYVPRLMRTSFSPLNQIGNRTWAMFMWFNEMDAVLFDPKSLKQFFSDYFAFGKENLELASKNYEDIPNGGLKEFEELGGGRFHREGDPTLTGLQSQLEKQFVAGTGIVPKKSLFERKLPRAHRFTEYAKELYMRPDKAGAYAIYRGLVRKGVPKLVAIERARAAIIDTAKTGVAWQWATHSGMSLFAGWRMEAIPFIMKQLVRSPLSAVNGLALSTIATVAASAVLGASPFNPFGEEKERARQFLPTKLQPTGIEALGLGKNKTVYGQMGDMFNPYTMPTDFIRNGWGGVSRTLKGGGWGELMRLVDNQDTMGRPIYDEALLLTDEGKDIAKRNVWATAAKWYFGPPAKAAGTLYGELSRKKDRFGNPKSAKRAMAQSMMDTILGIRVYEIDARSSRSKNLKDISAMINMLENRTEKLRNKDEYYLRTQGISDNEVKGLIEANGKAIRELNKKATGLSREPLPGRK